MSALAKLKVRESAISSELEVEVAGELEAAIDELGRLSEQYHAISAAYELAKKRVAKFANAIQDGEELPLEGYEYRAVYAASSQSAVLAVPVEDLFEAVGLEGFSPSIKECRRLLSEENFKIAFNDKWGSRKLSYVTKYR